MSGAIRDILRIAKNVMRRKQMTDKEFEIQLYMYFYEVDHEHRLKGTYRRVGEEDCSVFGVDKGEAMKSLIKQLEEMI